MKKALSVMLAGSIALSLAGCTGSSSSSTSNSTQGTVASTEITLWTYPIGSWQKADVVDEFLTAFSEQYPEIQVKVEYLDYANGDDKVTTAIEAKNTPDIIFEGPERLVSNWGAKGLMVSLNDLWTQEAVDDISKTSSAVVNACKGNDGNYYEYPLCMTAHNMAINYEVFEKANALQYIDENTRSWTTENFEKALKAIQDSGLVQVPAVIYCGGQGGDQGTRALVTNLYNGKYTNADHTQYTANSPENIKALEKIQEWHQQGLVNIDPSAQAAEELQLFANGTTAMTFAWNASNEATYAEQTAFTPYAMNFPSSDGTAELCGGIWGFGIFDNGDSARIDASKKFIDFICNDTKQAPASIKATGFFPVRSSFGNVYASSHDAERMEVFSGFLPNMGDYYNVTGGWAPQRTAWWNMLQEIGKGASVQASVDKFVKEANAGIAS